MGVWIRASKPVESGNWDKVRFYRSTDKATWTLLAEQDLTDMTYYDKQGNSSYYYAVSYYDSTNDIESDKSEPLRITGEVYTNAFLVASFLGLETDELVSKVQDIDERIKRAEDYIDSETGRSWKTRTVENEYLTPVYLYDYDRWAVFPKYSPIQSVSKLEVWNGSQWEDFTETKEEGRDKSYWIDYKNGIIFIPVLYSPFFLTMPRSHQIRVTYTYGEGATESDRSNVPQDLEDVATKLVAIDILLTENYQAVLPTGENAFVDFRSRIEEWRKDIQNFIDRHRSFKPLGNMWR